LHIIVCIKSVPDTTEVRFHPETNTLMREGVAAQINPFDLYAIEEAVRLKEAHGGAVTVITMGPPRAEDQLRDALAVGCDEAILLSARAFAGSDTWATAYTLAQAIRKLAPFDLILCGKQAIDGDTGQVGPGIATQLGLSQLTYVSRLRDVDPTTGTLRAERLLEEGCEIVETRLPALLTVLKDINKPRDPTPRLLRRARRAEIPAWTEADLPDADPRLLGLDGSPTKVVQVFSPPGRAVGVHWITGDTPEALAEQLATQLISEGLVG
jgi:electron transfer flavoprotein beta subunit